MEHDSSAPREHPSFEVIPAGLGSWSYPTAKVVHDHYWKLGSTVNITCVQIKAFLSDKGYRIKNGHLKIRLLEHLYRCQRQLPSYEACSRAELIKFCRERAVRPEGRADEHLISALERADDEPIFHRFLSLPAELRLRIYSLHIQWLGDGASRDPWHVSKRPYWQTWSSKDGPAPDHTFLPPSIQQPPLLLTNRQLRQEAMPVFYGELQFQVVYDRIKQHICPTNYKLVLQPRSLVRVDNAVIGLLRSISLKAQSTHDSVSHGKVNVTCTLTLRGARPQGSKPGIRIDALYSKGVCKFDYSEDETVAILREAHRVVHSVLDRDATQPLCRADFYMIGEALKEDLGRLV